MTIAKPAPAPASDDPVPRTADPVVPAADPVLRPADPVLRTARSEFGLSYLYPYQRLVIANTLDAGPEGRRQIVVLPTGSGKTLCFTLPALLLPGLTVVVYPLLALMDDQMRRIAEAGIATRILRGGQTTGERERIFAALESGQTRCLLANPEVLAADTVRRRLRTIPVSHLVVDEAHCVSEWGQTFRPAYLSLSETLQILDPAVTTAFTATASPLVLEAVRSILFGDEPAKLVQGNPDRANISYSVLRVDSKEAALATLVRDMPRPAIVFCRSRKRAEAVARDLASSIGFDLCAAYHAGLTKRERAAIESWFFGSTGGVLAATCAYGMGVDKSDVRTVIHYDLPASVEAFLQESGRAGRDGSPARSVVLDGGTATPAASDPTRREREETMIGFLSCPGCRRTYLMTTMGAEPQTCFGCDHCTPETEPEPIVRCRSESLAARARSVALVRRHRRVFTPDQVVRRVEPSWSESARRELVATLIQTQAIRRVRRGPWRGRLTTTPSSKDLT
ncbi:MAG: RecQ family ATP-dependent DNA helicase [Spirochaetota bacterium]